MAKFLSAVDVVFVGVVLVVVVVISFYFYFMSKANKAFTIWFHFTSYYWLSHIAADSPVLCVVWKIYVLRWFHSLRHFLLLFLLLFFCCCCCWCCYFICAFKFIKFDCAEFCFIFIIFCFSLLFMLFTISQRITDSAIKNFYIYYHLMEIHQL